MSRSPIIALTGATGFIGGAVARRLLREGWEVRALYRPSSRNDPVACAGLSWIPGSLEDTEALARLVAGADALVHCAGVGRGAGRDVFDRVNAEGVARIAARAAAAQVPRFLLMSSLAAREPQLSPYAASKRAGEVALVRTAGAMAWVVLRPPAVYGPGDRELRTLFRCIGHGLLPVLSGAAARFSLLYVDDLAAAVACWLREGGGEGRAFELHDGHPGGYSWADVAHSAQALLGRRVRRVPVPAAALKVAAAFNLALAVTGYRPMLTPGKVRELRHPDWVCDDVPFREATGWRPEVGLEEALRRTFGWGGRPGTGGRAA